MILLDAINKIITEHGSADVLDKHLAFVRDQAIALDKQVSQLQLENATLKQRVAHIEHEASSRAAEQEFVECRGALFKRKPGGGYHMAVYCPRCHMPMVSLMDHTPFNCGACRVGVSFTGLQLRAVMRELP
jgi:regulator of replication initiation timing